MTLKMHPREEQTHLARLDIRRAVNEAGQRNKLTTCELVMILTDAIREHVALELRVERHGDVNAPAGLVCSDIACTICAPLRGRRI